MTAERRREMQVLRKQACITEVRLKTKSREKEFLNRVERSLEEIQRETSEKEMSSHRRVTESSHFTPSTESCGLMQTNNNASDEGDTDSTVPGETIHLKPTSHTDTARTKSTLHQHTRTAGRRDSTSTQTSDSDGSLIVVTVPRIHRRRRESGGSTGSETSPPDASRQRTASNSSVNSEPARVGRPTEVSELAKMSVRRTGSDGCKLRRSGSERSLKRSGSDRALRRTGSGDIPTAIMSESTPRMRHRRVGSADMSPLASNKQSAINKLTRSYDMSIRSLMSEELSVKVLQSNASNAGDHCSSELLAEPMPANHGMLISPKYTSHSKESGGSAVKLLPRPATQPLKKQSPGKEPGPPQPLKGIHTLPPSLPTSRENTSESLLPRSGADTESEEDTGAHKAAVDNTSSRAEPASIDVVSPSYRSARKHRSQHDSVDPQGGELEPAPKEHSSTDSTVQAAADRLKPSTHPLKPSTHATDPELPSGSQLKGSRDYEKEKELGAPAPPAVDLWMTQSGPTDSPGFHGLPKSLATSSEYLIQQWLVDKVSQLHCSGQVNMEHWLQNAPDSVKHKLSQLLPKDSNARPSSPVRDSVDASIDDTLRGTSPIPDSEQVLPANEEGEMTPGKETHKPLFVRSSSYTLDKPSAALLSVDRASRTKFPSNSPPKFFPSPDKSDCLPSTHNRVETKHSFPLNFSSESLGSQASKQEPVASQPTATPHPLHVGTDFPFVTAESSGFSPNAIERNKAIASKSYIVDRPSAALLDSLNESQKSAMESAISSVLAASGADDDETSMVSDADSTLRLSTADSKSSAVRRGVQRRLDYVSLGNVATADQSATTSSAEAPTAASAADQSRQYESSDMPKRVHIQRYLQQLGLAERPVREAWADTLTRSVYSQSKSVRSQAMATSSGSDISSGVATVPAISAATTPASTSPVIAAATSPVIAAYTSPVIAAASPTSTPKSNSPQRPRTQSGRKTSAGRSSSFNDKVLNNQEMVNRARRELTLLKSKHSSKLSPQETGSQPRPGSAEPSTTTTKQTKDQRPSTSAGRIAPYTQRQSYTPHQQQPVSSSDRNLAQLRERLAAHGSGVRHAGGASMTGGAGMSGGPGVWPGGGHAVKSFAEKEATPISISGYSPSIDDSVSEYSSYGAIHSVSHPRPNTASSPHHDSLSSPQAARHHSSGSGARLAAVIRGHLCRRLLATCKVRSIVKTINDCRSLLAERTAVASADGSTRHSQNLAKLQDLNFQQRLLDQWEAALDDIHEIFFELTVDKRIALIQQSEIMDAKAKAQHALLHKQTKAKVVRRTSNKEQQPPKRRISAATQKVIERKKVQKATAEPALPTKPSTKSTLKKAVLAPTFAANSPKKFVPAVSGTRLSYLRESPTQRPHESHSRHASKV